MLSLFKSKSVKPRHAQLELSKFNKQLQARIDAGGNTFLDPAIGAAAISLEGYSEPIERQLDNTLQELNVALESILADMGVDLKAENPTVNSVQIQAAKAAGIMASNVEAFLTGSHYAAESISLPQNTKTETWNMANVNVSDSVSKRLALEAYDERDNKNAMVYSVAYNMQAAKQDAFAEMFFPTVVVTPDQVGFTMSIRLINVYNEVRRDISGAPSMNFGKRNIVQAVIDPTILRNDTTRIYPVYRPDSEQYFVNDDLIAPITITTDEGQAITTSPLAINTKFSLLGLAQTDVLLQTGVLDSTDAIDTAIGLDNLYVSISGTVNSAPVTEVYKFLTRRLPLATFNYAPQDNYRVMVVNFSTQSLLINGSTTTVAGATSQLLAPIAAGNYSVRLGLDVSGKVNCELGDTNMMASDIEVFSVWDQYGNSLSLTTGEGQTIAALFANAQVIGYDLEARLTNSNRRQRGQLLDTTFYNQVYAVPLRSPITIPRPLTIGDANDSSDLASLITATHIRTTNAAIDELINTASVLENYVTNLDPLGTVPDVLGVTRFLVQPFYEANTIDVAAVMNSLTSVDRPFDLSAVLVNYIRDVVYRMYLQSGYKAAADALAGGIGPVPTVIIGTDPVIARYINIDGDLRTLGGSFNVRIESTLNLNVRGKIYISFGEFGQGKEGVPNPMHFGNMAWKPELTLVLPLHRNGANSKELTVQPSFLHVVNLPILAVFTVENIEAAAVNKTAIDFLSVTSGSPPVPSPAPSGSGVYGN
jgi:hypothetical protein